jgi:uncharacterized protein with ATP-grasp and redox domains
MIPSKPFGLSIPQPLCGSEIGTFAHDTVTRRMPVIVRRAMSENAFSPGVVQRLEALIEEIAAGPVRALEDSDAPDAEDWQRYLQPYLGWDWLRIPWFFAEFYFYRRILEATGYFRSSEVGFGVDPYTLQKQRSLEATRGALHPLSAKVNRWITERSRGRETLLQLLLMDLWGNQADMSLWPVDAGDSTQRVMEEGNQEHILINDAIAVADHLLSSDPGEIRIDLLLDNAGFELLVDLYLADYLLGSNLARTVHLHHKVYPVFVSDAVGKDVEQTVAFLAAQSNPEVDLVASRLLRYLGQDRLILRQDSFWMSPLAMWEMPEHLRSDLGRSHLVISKGDANYRRLLGDRHWPYTTPFTEIMRYFPSPITALRTNKSEVICGLEADRVQALARMDPKWMTNGQWGLIQFRT